MFGKEKKEIKIRAIIELMGRPPEFLTETINKTLEALEKEDGIKIVRKEIFEPKEMEEEKSMFSSFVEMELITKNIEKMFEFILMYMPSNVEIIEPSELSFQAGEANAIFNNIIEKIHRLDSIAKRMGFENMYLKRQLEAMMPKIKVEENLPKEEKSEEKKEEKIEDMLGEEKSKKKAKK